MQGRYMIFISVEAYMKLTEKYNWAGAQNLVSKSFTCGYCGNPIASQFGYIAQSVQPLQNIGHKLIHIYICHFCSRPTYFDWDGEQIPGKAYGNDIENIDEETVDKLYQEARRATSANCFTAAVLCCRKLLMHISVSKGAEPNKSFAHYVNYLSDNHYVPPGAQIWVDHIREKGNEANHEISIMSPEEAKELLDFCEMLLKIIYEFPANVKKKYLGHF
ncbi:MAG: DUF4145 domain-containing protein [Ignavibacteriaceae bacterium]